MRIASNTVQKNLNSFTQHVGKYSTRAPASDTINRLASAVFLGASAGAAFVAVKLSDAQAIERYSPEQVIFEGFRKDT